MGDRIECGTFCVAAVLTSGNLQIKGFDPKLIRTELTLLKKIGAKIKTSSNEINIEGNKNLNSIKNLATKEYPDFPTDLQAQWIALMSVADGTSVVTETIYLDRFSHVPELVRLGANISLENNIAIIRGQKSLTGAQVMSTDIRASASLVIAALIADGRSDISRIYHIDRGYEQIEEKFKLLGADIFREKE